MQVDKIERQLFDELFGDSCLLIPQKRANREVYLPTCHIDLKETPESFHVKAELPGLAKEDINVTTDKNVLTISAEKKKETKKEKERWFVEERRYGKIERSIRLPESCDFDKVNASYVNGVLELVFGKKPEAISKKIEIS